MSEEELVEACARAAYEDSDNRPDWGPWDSSSTQMPAYDGKSIADIYRQAARAIIPIVKEADARIAEGFEPRTAESSDEFLAACEAAVDIAAAIRGEA